MPKETYLKMPVDVEQEMFALIKRSYTHAAAEMGEHEFKYIEHKIKNKLAAGPFAKLDWVGRLFKQYECLYEILRQHKLNKVSLSEKGCRLIGAALFYFINPYDVIQDFVETIGYADDYYVFILCLESLGIKDKKIVKTALSKIIK